MIEFHHVTKTYPRTHTHAVRDVDFHIKRGEFVYVTGHSGAGKSTLLALMLRRITPTEGSVSIAGHRSEEHTSELQSRENLVCRLLLEKKNKTNTQRQ